MNEDADQSCGECGSQGIQLLPLGREVRLLLNSSFESLHFVLDGAAHGELVHVCSRRFRRGRVCSQSRSCRTHIVGRSLMLRAVPDELYGQSCSLL